MNVVTRSLQTLSLIGEAQHGLSLTQVSEQLGFPLATAHRILKVLTDEDFVRRDPVSLEYFAGRRLQRIAALTRRESIAAAAQVDLQSLNEQFNETTMLTQLIDGRAVCTALVESRRALHLSVSVGSAVPLHAAASARVLYSDLDDAAVAALLADHEFIRLLPDTPADTQAVIEHLENIRRHGYDVCDNEFDFDVWAASAPVRDVSGRIVAGITLTMPRERSTAEELREQIIAAVVSAADDVTAAIGGTPRPTGERVSP